MWSDLFIFGIRSINAAEKFRPTFPHVTGRWKSRGLSVSSGETLLTVESFWFLKSRFNFWWTLVFFCLQLSLLCHMSPFKTRTGSNQLTSVKLQFWNVTIKIPHSALALARSVLLPIKQCYGRCDLCFLNLSTAVSCVFWWFDYFWYWVLIRFCLLPACFDRW